MRVLEVRPNQEVRTNGGVVFRGKPDYKHPVKRALDRSSIVACLVAYMFTTRLVCMFRSTFYLSVFHLVPRKQTLTWVIICVWNRP